MQLQTYKMEGFNKNNYNYTVTANVLTGGLVC